MAEQDNFIQRKKFRGEFFLLCIISTVLAMGVFWLIGNGQYIKEEYLTLTVSIMLVFGIYLDSFRQKQSAFYIAILGIISNSLLILLVKDWYGLVFFLNACIYVISIADFCYLLDYDDDKTRNYFVNLALLGLFLLFYIGSLVMLYVFFSIIQSV